MKAMNYPKTIFLALSLMLTQRCLATYTPQYDTYTQFFGDDTYIYQTVVVEGTTTGDCYHPCNCGQYVVNNAKFQTVRRHILRKSIMYWMESVVGLTAQR